MSLCTMFAFEGVEDPNLLHCTHRFFGDDSPVTVDQVIKVLREHFKQKPFEEFHPTFDQLEQLGEDKDYRTVTSKEQHLFLPDLKAKLDLLHPDKFPEYKPHVTVGRNVDELKLPVRDYVLMDDHKPVWSAVKDQEKAKAAARMIKEFRATTRRLSSFEDDLDESTGTKPKKKTPAEMNQNPLDLLNTEDPSAQRALDQTWDVTSNPKPPGSGASEGQGEHDWSINDNDSRNGPAR